MATTNASAPTPDSAAITLTREQLDALIAGAVSKAVEQTLASMPKPDAVASWNSRRAMLSAVRDFIEVADGKQSRQYHLATRILREHYHAGIASGAFNATDKDAKARERYEENVKRNARTPKPVLWSEILPKWDALGALPEGFEVPGDARGILKAIDAHFAGNGAGGQSVPASIAANLVEPDTMAAPPVNMTAAQRAKADALKDAAKDGAR